MKFTILPFQVNKQSDISEVWGWANAMVVETVGRKIWRSGKLKKIRCSYSYLVDFGIILKIIWGNDMVYTTVTNKLLDEKIYEAISQISHRKKQCSDIEGIYDYIIKVDLLVDMPSEVLEERFYTLEMEDKIVNKFKDADSFYIRKKFLR